MRRNPHSPRFPQPNCLRFWDSTSEEPFLRNSIVPGWTVAGTIKVNASLDSQAFASNALAALTRAASSRAGLSSILRGVMMESTFSHAVFHEIRKAGEPKHKLSL
jgi:hypothetical protein